MSDKRKKVTIRQLRDKKAAGERIISLGVYDAPMATIADRVGFDLLIVGNAGPMALLGHADPTTVTFDEQVMLTRAVSRVVQYGLVVGQLPYMSYHASKEQAVTSAARMVSEGGADCVKCEGNRHTAEYVAEIVRAGIPVMGHMGMQASRRVEQSGFGVKGRTAEEALEIVDSTKAFAQAGCFAFIVEQVPNEVTRYLSQHLDTPIVGLGAAPEADGVYHISGDLVSYSAFPIPPNRGNYADVGSTIEQAMQAYRRDAAEGAYPPRETAYQMQDGEHARFLELADAEPELSASGT
jgi:3-methyl-2-oxobutanoate hydroxymethyltransferase